MLRYIDGVATTMSADEIAKFEASRVTSPQPTTPLPAPQPTRAELMARLLQIQRQIEALSA